MKKTFAWRSTGTTTQTTENLQMKIYHYSDHWKPRDEDLPLLRPLKT